MALTTTDASSAAGTREHARRGRQHPMRRRVAYAPAERAEPWLRHFRCTRRDLADAVRTVGDDPLDVAVYFERRC